MSEDVKTVDGAYVRIEGHEELCAERYRNIQSQLGELKTSSQTQQRVQWGVLIALLGFMALQLWNSNQSRLDKLEHPASAPAVAYRSTTNQHTVITQSK